MKLFFVIALLCASVCSFAQRDTRSVTVCGGMYLREYAQRCATEAAVINYFSNPDEAYVGTTYTYTIGIGWFYTNTYQCVLQPLNKEDVPEVAKVVKSQAQIDCAMIPYVEKSN